MCALNAAKSSVHGFMRGLLARGWLYEEQGRYYLGPAVYSLTLASGHIRAGLVTHADLAALHEETGVAVFLGVQAGDHLMYIAEAGSDAMTGFEARSNIRRPMLATAGEGAALAARSDGDRVSYLRRRSAEEADLVDQFLAEYAEIKRTRIAQNMRRGARDSVSPQPSTIRPARPWQPSRSSASPLRCGPACRSWRNGCCGTSTHGRNGR